MQKFIFLNQNCRSLTGARSNALVTVVTNKWLLLCNQFSSVIAFAFCHVLLGFWGYTHSILVSYFLICSILSHCFISLCTPFFCLLVVCHFAWFSVVLALGLSLFCECLLILFDLPYTCNLFLFYYIILCNL